ncbi:MAG: threonine synthase [Peptococcaceae bacterium]|jgi:threonine synthase|nr:threonine synthase [Peptococcaceae bacterium]
MYISTRDNHPPVTASGAIYLGMVPAGGLFVPETVPKVSPDQLRAWRELPYPALAAAILRLFLDDYTEDEIKACADAAYGSNFFHGDIAPLTWLDGLGGFLELWHGPTAAFKDMALQLTPRLLERAMVKVGGGKTLLILVATSGDTGKAALEGFKNVPGIKILCFYPDQGVSKAQELQMTTTDGENTFVVAVEGNFDDCQNGVKAIFGDEAFNQALAGQNIQMSSANSINWGRLCPQIVYYFHAYFQLLRAGRLTLGQPFHAVVPTGNFGNILSAWYAREMGLPIGKLICASNANRVLTDFFAEGIYDRRRDFYKTASPSMDILISSNLERFLFEISGHDAGTLIGCMRDLGEKGRFAAAKGWLERIRELLWAGSADDREAAGVIQEVFARHHYTLDTHTSVAAAVYGRYRRETGDDTPAVIDATASPFKFAGSVLAALGQETKGLDELGAVAALSLYSGQPIHPALAGLEKRPVRHRRRAAVSEMREIVAAVAAGTFPRPASS